LSRHRHFVIAFGILFSIILSLLSVSCSSIPLSESGGQPPIEQTSTLDEVVDLNVSATQTPETLSTPKPVGNFFLWISPSLPVVIKQKLVLPPDLKIVNTKNQSNIQIEPIQRPDSATLHLPGTNWIYVLVAPFPTVTDEVKFADLKDAWAGKGNSAFDNSPLMMPQETLTVFETIWGKPKKNAVRVVEDSQLLDTAWSNQPSWAIIPFDQLSPRWKVLAVDKMSPLDKKMDPNKYPLSVFWGFTGEVKVLGDFGGFIGNNKIEFPKTNRDPQQMTVLVMTGTTAMVRYLALRMEEKGITYPARDVLSWLKDADITHISNEAPFYDKCPPAKPLRREARFCSSPAYLELLKYVGADIIELTGNHILDWGEAPFLYTLDLYKQNGFLYFGGGKNLEDAQKSIYIEDHGNKLAFIGCNSAGPPIVWATKQKPGAAPCDIPWMNNQIQEIMKKGYIPIVTFQHFEVDDYVPNSLQRVQSLQVADAGAVIVSGSQSHFPQGMTFVGNQFIHYGLGNMFFDQMMKLNRREFIDRHVFYGGKYISTVLLVAMLEDYSRPRPMTPEERAALLNIVFKSSGW